MKHQEIEFIKSLDPEEIDGTIQSILMREDLQYVPFIEILKFLVKAQVGEKLFLVKQNISLWDEIRQGRE